MSKPVFDHSQLVHLSRRAQVPLLASHPQFDALQPDHTIPDPKNVQGDIYMLFPKDYENFLFFEITNATQFVKDLATFVPTTSEDVIDNLRQITVAKASQAARVELCQSQIAFSREGLNLLGHTEKTLDVHFDNGPMRKEKTELGDLGQWHEPFNSQTIHGVFSVAASHQKVCEQGTKDIRSKFSSSIKITELQGKARPVRERGHEHFGFKDGVSQPALRGLVPPKKGQNQCDSGVVIMGYQGDPFFNDPNNVRPDWTKDGSIMVFRKLEQLVPEFDNFLAKSGPKWREWMSPTAVKEIAPPLSDKEGAALWGARMIGRWKSGAPLANAPYRDDPSLTTEDNANNFDYSIKGISFPTDKVCPFACHTRKTAPRNLDPFVQKSFLESTLVVRAGLPYGEEVTQAETNSGKSRADPNRGLLFVCYQSSTVNGFWQQTSWGNNDFFPVVSFTPTKSGQDPIIGYDPTHSLDYFVNSRGGEYFFVPSPSILQAWAGGSPGPTPAGKPQPNPPTQKGVYRIRTLLDQQSMYWELLQRGNEYPWVNLMPLNLTNDAQKWLITPLGNDQFQVASLSTNLGLIVSSEGYQNYGHPIGSSSGSATWIMKQQTYGGESFTKIWKQGDPNYGIFDAYASEQNVIRFYRTDDTAPNQRFLFEPC